MQGINQAVAVVTGGGTKIGRAAAERFAEAGATVAVVDGDATGGLATVDAITEAGGTTEFYHVDVGQEAHWERLLDEVVEDFGSVDCCFVDAEVDPELAQPGDTDPELEGPVQPRVPAVFHGLKHVAARMKAQPDGGAVVSTLGAAHVVGDGDGTPRPDELGLAGLHRAAATTYAPHGVRVNAVRPGIVRSVDENVVADGGRLRHRETGPRADEPVDDPHGHRRVDLATPSQVATAVVWLCSDAAEHVTGYPMVVTGDDPIE
jgi:NAD(P)-dependent dehydrogenase (short-subunit alcohol dehydrogenase family)